ncbi:hypothetical protein K9M47_04880 [Candidatus Gracilibacteria bacterium]|nr:hypothetical protein [Candidatus Gracilibacteria bacterium]MCF7898909.1 hypothetical protein [Candidatus Paceibacterota bacterium]
MDDPVIQIEVALSFVNTLLAKTTAFKDEKHAQELRTIRYGIYHGDDFNYEEIIEKLKKIDTELKKYDIDEKELPVQDIKDEVQRDSIIGNPGFKNLK